MSQGRKSKKKSTRRVHGIEVYKIQQRYLIQTAAQRRETYCFTAPDVGSTTATVRVESCILF